MNLEQRAKNFREEVFSHMLETRGKKYGWFLRGLKSFRYFSNSSLRGELLESAYAVFRYVDDIVDGDMDLPKGYYSSEEFVQSKIDFSQNLFNPKDDLDATILYFSNISKRLGFTVSDETRDILSSLLFDAKRYRTKQIFSEKELNYHFNLLDIRGTIRGALKVSGKNFDRRNILEPLGFASRIYYNLRDFDEDIRVGFVNISAEDCNKHSISRNDLENKFSMGVRRWFRDQASRGNELIQQYHSLLTSHDFGILANLALKYVFENPSKKYFDKILSGRNS